MKKVTEAVFEAYGIPKEHIIVTIKGILPEDVGVGGQLIADRRREQ